MTDHAHTREGERLTHAADLDWYFNERDGDLGLHGQNYDPEQAHQGAVDPERNAVRRTAAIQRERRIKCTYDSLSQDDRIILRVAFLEHRWRGLERWGRAAGVAAWQYDPVDKIDGGIMLGMLVGQAGGEAILAGYRERAETALKAALAAYARAHSGVLAVFSEERVQRKERDRKQAHRAGLPFRAPTPEEDEG